jgi:hypothetical protein
MAKAKEETTSVPALIVTPDKAPVVSGNFEQIEAYLQKWQTQVSKMDMTESNVEQVRLIKKEASAYRNSLIKIQNDIKRTYFNDPKAVFEAKMGSLLGVVSKVEAAADKVLAVEEKERVDGINEVIDHYIENFQGQYGLDEGRLSRIERKKSYYNKTADEKARKDDIELQFKDLKREQDAHAASIRLVEAACKDEPRLNAQHWIDRLRQDDVAIVTEAVTAEKHRLQELDRQERDAAVAQTVSSAVEDVDCEVAAEYVPERKNAVLGIPVPNYINFHSDFKGRTKTMRIELVYPCDLGDALTQLFAELKHCGIKVRALKEPVKLEEGYTF